jgi:ribosomal protein S18 acetylase RimI-like enzyme
MRSQTCVTEKTMMVEITVENVQPDARATLAAFLFTNNRAPTCCLHAHAGETASAYAAELAGLPPDEAAFVVAKIDGAMVGVMGAEFEAGGDRAWLRGPVASAALDPTLAAAVCDALWSQLPSLLPTTAVRQDGFPEETHSVLRAWYARHGFSEQPHYFVYEAKRPERLPDQPAPVTTASPNHHASLVALAKFVFPTGYLTDAQLCATNDDDHAVFVIADGGRVDGYVYITMQDMGDEPPQGYVDYLVVRPQARGLGYGRLLLQAALAWSFGVRGAPLAALTVAADNANAKSLYHSVGFALVSTGVPMRRDLPKL